MAFLFNMPEEQRLTRPRLSIPNLAAALAGSGQSPQSQPFYAALPDDVRRLFMQAYGQYGGGSIGSPFGSEYNLAPAQSILGSSAYQGADQPTQGHILDLVQSITAGQAPGLTQALSAPSVPTGGQTQGAPPPPSPSPAPAPQPAPQDPYAPWGGYGGYLRWLYGLGNGPDRGGDVGSGGDVGAGGEGGGGSGGGGGGAL